ncbi:LysR substrate-binding domain-containing protein [Rhodoligotrophos defluvii]|uniref:LysR substrate-binding domain-containing protein n=1 Tax=Rhodoligotrophos defluvii TaxID=2561934 RepID=UPI001484F746|nr:LysR substrate-binding domain-containing protein [Rhodoligotrophos defluvii]
MPWPARTLPSMSALRAFDAVARHGAIWAAARELGRTPSAISHQLRFLEKELGAPLFARVGKVITLTPFGRRYAEEVHRALRLIARAADAADDVELRGSLTISCTSGFATFWLCGHLSDFRSLYPHVRLRIVTPRRLDDVSDPEADVFIAFGRGAWPDHWSELLARVEFSPVCSPGLLNALTASSSEVDTGSREENATKQQLGADPRFGEKRKRAGGLRLPEDLARLTLLHLHDHNDWALWLGKLGLPMPPPETGIVFSDIYLAQAAAIAGQGIAMGDDIVCGRALADGLLVRPFEHAIPSPDAYYLVCERERLDQPAVSAFRSWLRACFS